MRCKACNIILRNPAVREHFIPDADYSLEPRHEDLCYQCRRIIRKFEDYNDEEVFEIIPEMEVTIYEDYVYDNPAEFNYTFERLYNGELSL